MAAIPQDVMATINMTAMLSAATNAASVVQAYAGRRDDLTNDEQLLYRAAMGLLREQFAFVLIKLDEQRQASK